MGRADIETAGKGVKFYYSNTIMLFSESFASAVNLNASAVFSIGNLCVTSFSAYNSALYYFKHPLCQWVAGDNL